MTTLATPRRRRWPWVAAFLLALCAVPLLLLGTGTGSGPLSVSTTPAPLLRGADASGMTFPVPKPGEFGFGLDVLTNHSTQTVVIDSAVLLRPTPGMHTVAVYGVLLAPHNESTYSGWPGWPPPARFVPRTYVRRFRAVQGMRMPPGRTLNLVFRMSAARAGRYRTYGTTVTYHAVGGTQTYVLHDQLAYGVCVGAHSCQMGNLVGGVK